MTAAPVEDRRVRVTIEGDAATCGADILRVRYGAHASVLVDTTHPSVTVEDIVPPRTWTDGDVLVSIISPHNVAARRHGYWLWSANGVETTDDHVSALVAEGRMVEVLRYQAGGDR